MRNDYTQVLATILECNIDDKISEYEHKIRVLERRIKELTHRNIELSYLVAEALRKKDNEKDKRESSV